MLITTKSVEEQEIMFCNNKEIIEQLQQKPSKSNKYHVEQQGIPLNNSKKGEHQARVSTNKHLITTNKQTMKFNKMLRQEN